MIKIRNYSAKIVNYFGSNDIVVGKIHFMNNYYETTTKTINL